LLEEVERLGLKLNIQKTKYLKATESFDYLGYNFNNGQIRLGKSFINYTQKRWRAQFNFSDSQNKHHKLSRLRQALKKQGNNLNNDFRQIAEQKKLVTDTAQIKNLSESFFRILTRYIFRVYSPKNRRLLKNNLQELKLTSIYKHFLRSNYDS